MIKVLIVLFSLSISFASEFSADEWKQLFEQFQKNYRTFSIDDIKKTITETSHEYRVEWLASIKEKYDKVAMPTAYYEKLFDDKLKTLIEKNGA